MISRLKIPITQQCRTNWTTFQAQMSGDYKIKQYIYFRGDNLDQWHEFIENQDIFCFPTASHISYTRKSYLKESKKKWKHKTYLICRTDKYKVSYARRYAFTYHIHIEATQMKDPEQFTTGYTKICIQLLPAWPTTVICVYARMPRYFGPMTPV